MLTVEPAAQPQRSHRRVALALAGGGPLGAFYQLGALHAIAECTTGLDLTTLHGYVGVSSGAIIAACLANGLTTDDLVSAFFCEPSASSHPLTPGTLMRPALEEYSSRLAALPRLLGELLTRWARDPSQSWAAILSPLTSAIPTGIFDNRGFERYLRDLLSREGRTNDFRKLARPLRIIATDLNEGSEVRFGEPGFDGVPISQAICASTALPGLYTPVRLQGRTYVDGALLRTVHASLVLEHGAELVISINPLVTFSAKRSAIHSTPIDLAERGLLAVLGQTFRALIQSRMHVGMASYHARYPKSDRLLLQPDRDDEVMFFANVFRYSERRRLADHAYQRTRQDLLTHARELEPLLGRHGIHLRHDRLRDRHRSFLTSVEGTSDVPQSVTRNLEQTLERLTELLDESKRTSRSKRRRRLTASR